MTEYVVVDKSYLQGAPRIAIAEIASVHGLLMSEALLYELVKAESIDRAKWFSKFPDKARPFELVPNPGTLFRTEISENRPCGLPSRYVRHIDHSYTKLYCDPKYAITGKLADVLDDKRNDIQEDVDFLVGMVSDIPKLFPQLESARPADRQTLYESAELKICNDVDFVRVHATELVLHSPYHAGESLPAIDKTWITFRWFQVNMLFALDLWFKYPQGVACVGGEKLKERLRHDALDAQYLILGLLEGAFASNEKKLCRWWSMLKPEGKLYSV
ncbi:hypothetical protein F6X37_25585 [Paraburkholderia sp. 31.1]|uniref:hypothetical protein n=1 Tax=Paraburkholderia sp. 31.1 TaxID=2615205 RepID=UPI001655A8F2|nr:hypothetical protein [Paraburkholderia sp. 31.1]MBC8724830.1 hypothetical protein [Paraburkholderia sp. 31.1]